MAPRTNKNFELKSAKSFAMGVPVSPGKMVMDVEMAALDTASVMTVFLFLSKAPLLQMGGNHSLIYYV